MRKQNLETNPSRINELEDRLEFAAWVGGEGGDGGEAGADSGDGGNGGDGGDGTIGIDIDTGGGQN